MKKCPECEELFEDDQNFCDIDGTALIDEVVMLRTTLQEATGDLPETKSSNSGFSWSTATVGVLAGIVLCLGAYLAKLAMFPDSEPPNQKPSAVRRQPVTNPLFAQPIPARPQATAEPAAEPSPAIEEEQPSEVPPPTEESSPAKIETVAKHVNNGPISTGTKRSGEVEHAIITLKDGTSVAADAAWEDGQGIWYRRGGLVSFVERDRVETVTAPPEAKSSPSDGEKP